MMAKAILEFTWPEDKEELRYAIHGVDAIMGLRDLSERLRSYYKHGSANSPDEMLRDLQKEIWKILAECGEE